MEFACRLCRKATNGDENQPNIYEYIKDVVRVSTGVEVRF